MNLRTRGALDRVFTVLAGLSVVLLTLVLIGVLGPMVYRGSGAVLFGGTVEFRKMQRDLFKRGGSEALDAEIAQTEEARREVYSLIDTFRKGIDIEAISDAARRINRDFGEELRFKGVATERYTELRQRSRDIRDQLEAAFASQDINEIRTDLESVLQSADDPAFKGTGAEGYFKLAKDFLNAAEQVDLSKHHEYKASLQEVEGILFGSTERPGLLGPRPGGPLPPLAMLHYGATRWDQARQLLHQFKYRQFWVEAEPNAPLVRREEPRAALFAGTSLEPLFGYIQANAEKMLHPRFTVYWQYFLDDNVDSHYFGGVGPEIIGTLLITVLGMAFVVPLGVIAAAYLVECTADNWVMRIIRMSINTLAGVPSIVFGLFGLAFFILFLFPRLGFEPKPCILGASMTLAVLTLPVMIRASEEAIRMVPQSFKEGSLALGASKFRTFVTVTFPAALPGILTGMILSLSRIAGETAPILFTGAVWIGPMAKSVFEPTRTLSRGSYGIAVEDRLAMMVPHNQYGMVVTLILLILVLNAMAIVLRSRVFKKLKGQ
ncbi:MAG: phosphate ABC transporter permease PstA [Sedimentisphaerales bacterium]|nr:phosphate ABC transporter permease PstA [Sedimentisphaerales bacterium]